MPSTGYDFGASPLLRGTQDLETNTKFRHSAFSQAEWDVVPFEGMEGMKGEHTPEADLTRCHEVLEEENKFSRSAESGHTGTGDMRWMHAEEGDKEKGVVGRTLECRR